MSIGFFRHDPGPRTRIIYLVHDFSYTTCQEYLEFQGFFIFFMRFGVQQWIAFLGGVLHVFIAMGRLCFCPCPRPEVGWYGFGKPKSRTLEVFGFCSIDSNAGEAWLDTDKSCTENRWTSHWKGVITSEWSDWPDDFCLNSKLFKHAQQTSKEEHDTHEPASWIAARGAARSTAGTLVCQPCSVFGSKFGRMMLPFCRVLTELILGPWKIVLGSSNKISQRYTEFQVLGCQAGLPVTPRRLASKGPADSEHLWPS